MKISQLCNSNQQPIIPTPNFHSCTVETIDKVDAVISKFIIHRLRTTPNASTLMKQWSLATKIIHFWRNLQGDSQQRDHILAQRVNTLPSNQKDILSRCLRGRFLSNIIQFCGFGETHYRFYIMQIPLLDLASLPFAPWLPTHLRDMRHGIHNVATWLLNDQRGIETRQTIYTIFAKHANANHQLNATNWDLLTIAYDMNENLQQLQLKYGPIDSTKRPLQEQHIQQNSPKKQKST